MDSWVLGWVLVVLLGAGSGLSSAGSEEGSQNHRMTKSQNPQNHRVRESITKSIRARGSLESQSQSQNQ